MTNRLKSLTGSFKWLNATQFCGALNDNLLKLLIVFFIINLKGAAAATSVAAMTGAIFVVPFLLFTPLAGGLADRLSKTLVIRTMKVAEVVISLLAAAAFATASETALYGVLFLMASQSALFGPAKYGVVPELVERRELSRANSLIESVTYLAIILGSALAPFLAQISDGHFRLAAMVSIAISLIGLAASSRISVTPAVDADREVGTGLLTETFTTLFELRNDRNLLLALVGSAYFLFLGAFAQINLIPFGMEVHSLTQEQSGYLFLLAAFGIGLGSLLAGRLSGRNVELGLVPLGALGLATATCGLYLLPVSLTAHSLMILLLGTSAGLFLVPLHAFVQLSAPRQKLGRILAAGSFMSWCGVLLASGLAFVLDSVFDCTAAEAFLVLGLMTFGLTLISLKLLPDFLLRFIGLITMRFGYRIKVEGRDNVPDSGPALLVPNHVSWVDALLLLATQQRRIRFVMHRDIYNVRLLRPLFKLMGVIPVSAADGRRQKVEFIKAARKALDDGFMVCIFAEGMITRNGMLQPFKGGLEAIVKGTDYPVIPVHIGGAWGSVFSYAHGRVLNRFPARFPRPIAIGFGEPMSAGSSAAEVQQAVAQLSYAYFDGKKNETGSLCSEFVATAKRNWSRKALSDSSQAELSYGQTLSAALLLAAELKPYCAGQDHVGLLLPPSVGGALANIAVPLSGKVPVNLNYTASAESLISAMEQCQIETVVTSRKFIERFPECPLPEQTLYLEDLLTSLSKGQKAMAWIKARLLPSRILLRGLSQRRDELATLIFSSGSTGEPKGVMLSQHNILSNIEAISSLAAPSPQDDLCGALPFFHALGFTATLWLPLTNGFSASYHVNPMDAGTICKMVRRNSSTLMLTTPTFLSAYMRRGNVEDFASLRLVVTGAEKLKGTLAADFYAKFGIIPLEGYGATELAPLISLNLPDVVDVDVRQDGQRQGSVGRAIPGVVLHVIDPDSGEPMKTGESGLILVKGPNLMSGYLNRPDLTSAALVDGWYRSGDIGFIDSDGFLHITDRLARFSKIGGEMVPHVKVEELLCQHLNLSSDALAVTALPDGKKGEKLVVVSTAEAGELDELRKIGRDIELPNLWRPHPDNFVRVASLPLLGSGKLDLRGLKRLAEETVATVG